ncbi:glycosyltransferase [Actinophytocola oryzae]|uniref:Glycosyl transferase family 2 n=1 Tax=Actinophytocola oryzae TaxID=502181 RepID=A0A4R7VRQ2_9PSEU|nr:glycosyltransferase family 2 protein [Actinophytocola oryzae]TDV51897.1 glycosyl transferase family 2 [Actinophytocola oryzae]
MISAVAVVIPARDEHRRIRSCLRAVRHALDRLPEGITHTVCVVADRCTDHTAALAATELPTAHIVTTDADLTIGEVRDLGVRTARTVLEGHSAARTWLLSTDADTVVHHDWARRHVRLADAGIDAVAGVAHLDRPAGPTRAALERYAAVVGRASGPWGHGNVYGANLGVRADAFDAVGGFGAVPVGEDHDLWVRLGAAGYARRHADIPVVTSGRHVGRARGGLADLLAALGD